MAPTPAEVDYKSKPIDPEFLNKPEEYPHTGSHFEHKVFAEGIQRMDAEGKPYPTKKGIHGAHVAVDFDSCIADGSCLPVCPVEVFEWFLNPGHDEVGEDKKIAQGTPEWDEWRTDKAEPIRESDCIDCMACETACPVLAIKIFVDQPYGT